MKQVFPLSAGSSTRPAGRGGMVRSTTKRAAGGEGRRSLAPLEHIKKQLSKSEEDRLREVNLRAVLEHLPFPVVVHSLAPDGRVALLNRKFVEVFGYTPEELGTVLDWAHRAYPDKIYRAEVAARWSAAVRRALKGNGVVEEQEFCVTAKDGSVHDVILNGTVVDHRLLVVFRDVTEKKKGYADREFLRRTVEKTAYEVTKHIPVGTFTMALAPGASLPVFSFMSDRFLAMTGTTMEEARQDPRKVLARLHPEDREVWTKHGARMIAAKAPFRGEARWQVEGGVRWVTAEAVPRDLPDGTTVWEGVLIDITEQKDAEVKLRESQRELADAKEHYRLLAENAADVVMRCDQAGRIEWVTSSVTGLTGWLPVQLNGFLFKDFVYPDDRRLLAAAQDNVMDGTSGQVELRFRTSQGGYHWVAISLRPFFDQRRLANGYVAGWRDVQQEVQTQEAITLERARLKAALDALLDPHVMLDPVRDAQGQIVDFAVTTANPAACTYNQTTREKLIGRRLLESFPGYQAAGLFQLYRDTAESGRPLVLDGFAYSDEIHGAGRRLDIRAVKVNGSVSCTWRDVTHRYEAASRLAQSEEHCRLLTRNAYGTVVRTDAQGTILWVSPSLEAVLGYRPEEWVGRTASEILELDPAQGGPDDLQKLACGESVVRRYRVKDRQGQSHWVESFASPYVDPKGQINGVVTSFHIVDAQVAAERELERRARTDELTNLLNRKEVLERLDKLHGKKHRRGTRLAVLFCDLDKFKTVNDTHGHQVGDEVLRITAERLRHCLRTSDDLGARVGGDEMMVVLHGVHDLDDALQVAAKLRDSVAAPMPTSAGPLEVTMSVGVTLARKGEDTAALIARADDAMYQAKKTGRNQVIALPAAGAAALGE